MPVRVGCDVCSVSRVRRTIETYGNRFLVRAFAPAEVAQCSQSASPWSSYAARWAAKEAIFKALGPIARPRIAFSDICVTSPVPRTPPQVRLRAWAMQAARKAGVTAISVSLSHDGDYALACCIVFVR